MISKLLQVKLWLLTEGAAQCVPDKYYNTYCENYTRWIGGIHKMNTVVISLLYVYINGVGLYSTTNLMVLQSILENMTIDGCCTSNIYICV